jgi:hypothetical protein
VGVHTYRRHSLFGFFLAALVIAQLAAAVAGVDAAPFQPVDAGLPSLQEFSSLLINGEPSQLRGAYAPGLFADVVTQQPPGDPTYVAPLQNVLTQFEPAMRLGSVGLLAHNYLAGIRFAQLGTGQVIYLLYGDGRIEPYAVADVYRFQARDPDSPSSQFIDADGRTLNADSLFTRMYGRRGMLVFQTCIKAGQNTTWGRLFVVAQPYGGEPVPPSARISH